MKREIILVIIIIVVVCATEDTIEIKNKGEKPKKEVSMPAVTPMPTVPKTKLDDIPSPQEREAEYDRLTDILTSNIVIWIKQNISIYSYQLDPIIIGTSLEDMDKEFVMGLRRKGIHVDIVQNGRLYNHTIWWTKGTSKSFGI